MSKKLKIIITSSAIALVVLIVALVLILRLGGNGHEHKATLVSKVDAACIEDGHYEYYKCEDCNKIFEDEECTKEIKLDDIIISKLGHDPLEDDNDCTTPINCEVCGEIVTPGKEHTPHKNDGNCSTEQLCTECGQVAVEAKEHIDENHDYLCDNDGCQVSIGAPKDENEGIDLPIDRN